MSSNFKIFIALALLFVAYLAGWWCADRYAQPATIAITAKPPVRQADGSLKAGVSTAPPAPLQIVPKGSRVDSTFVALVAPEPPIDAVATGTVLAADADHPAETVTTGLIDTCEQLLQCPAVTLDGTLATAANGQPQLLLSTPNGTVETATLNAGATIPVPKVHPWGLGVRYGSGGRVTPVGTYSFQSLPIVVGADLGATPGFFVLGRF
jgi:hypothetical protein